MLVSREGKWVIVGLAKTSSPKTGAYGKGNRQKQHNWLGMGGMISQVSSSNLIGKRYKQFRYKSRCRPVNLRCIGSPLACVGVKQNWVSSYSLMWAKNTPAQLQRNTGIWSWHAGHDMIRSVSCSAIVWKKSHVVSGGNFCIQARW